MRNGGECLLMHSRLACIPRIAAALISLTRMPGTGPTPMAKASTYDSVPTSAMVPLMACKHAWYAESSLCCALNGARDHAHLLNKDETARAGSSASVAELFC
jgi:hypothetical protein